MIQRLLIASSALIAALLPIACNSGSSGRSQACLSSADCKDGLRCIPNAQGVGACVQNDYPIDPTSKECVTLECTTDASCCENFEPNFSCTLAQQQCDEDPEIFENSCEFAKSSACTCNLKCEENRCVSATTCEDDDDCSGSLLCSPDKKCVECIGNDDCDVEDGEICKEGSCEKSCSRNEDCPYLEECKAGECVYAGCTSDRECILSTGLANAICSEKSGKKRCSASCEDNLECGTLHACVDKECVYLGCDNNQECISLAKRSADFSGRELPQGWTAECREIGSK